jgi:hypothetical protein
MLSVLRFDTAKDFTDVETTTSLLMQVTGLRGEPPAVHASANWVTQQVRDGRQRLDIDMIKEAVKELDLRKGPSRGVLSVATLKPDPLADQASRPWRCRLDPLLGNGWRPHTALIRLRPTTPSPVAPDFGAARLVPGSHGRW